MKTILLRRLWDRRFGIRKQKSFSNRSSNMKNLLTSGEIVLKDENS